MVKFIALYKNPQDQAAFDKHYFEVHVPLCQKLPGIQKVEVTKLSAGMPGQEAPYYLMAELWFNSKAEMDAAWATAEGKAVFKDTRNFEPGLLTPVNGEVVS